MKTLFRALVAVSLITGTGVASAASVGGNFNVTANIAANCIYVSASTVAFGAYDPAAVGDDTATGSIVHRCTKGTSYTMTFSAGSSGDQENREMAGPGGDAILYNLYDDLANTNILGDGTGATTDLVATGNGIGVANNITTTIYATAPAGQDVNAGAYSDTITVTITY